MPRRHPSPSARRDTHGIVTGEPDDRKAITSGSGGGRREKDQHRWHLARRPTSPIQSLVAAFTADKAIVDESSARAAVAEVTAD
jgi:hypothetical protein